MLSLSNGVPDANPLPVGRDPGPAGHPEDVRAEHNGLLPHRRHEPELHQRGPQHELHHGEPESLFLEPGGAGERRLLAWPGSGPGPDEVQQQAGQ